MRRRQGALRPRRDPEPRGHPERRPARPPQGPEAHGHDLAAGRRLHRVRLLRAALPVPRPHPHPAPAHRGHARARAPARVGGRRGPGGRGDALAADFEYDGIATCAGDSMCQTSCPVKIDTGALVKETKAAALAAPARGLARLAARRFGLTSACFEPACAWPASSAAVARLGARALDVVTEVLHQSGAFARAAPRARRRAAPTGAPPARAASIRRASLRRLFPELPDAPHRSAGRAKARCPTPLGRWRTFSHGRASASAIRRE